MDGISKTMLEVFATLLDVLLSIMSIILSPFYAIIDSLFPAVDDFFGSISDYFDLIGTYTAYGLDALMIPASVLILLYGFYLFRFTVQFVVWNIKRIVIWAVLVRLIGPKL